MNTVLLINYSMARLTLIISKIEEKMTFEQIPSARKDVSLVQMKL